MRNSRRARLVLTLLLLAAFTLITLDYKSNSLSGVRNATSTVFGPIEDAVTDVTHPIGSWFTSIGRAGKYQSENNQLRQQVAQLQSQLHLTAEERVELTQDQKLLHIAGLAQYSIVAARVVAIGGGLVPEQSITINVGSANGIRAEETVIDGDGLVGKTISVGAHSATVLLANDPTFTVGARLETKELELGSVTGGGLGKPLTMRLLNSQIEPTRGEQLVTEGDSTNSDTPFVPEVPIGTITHVNPLNGGLTWTATVRPFADFTGLDIVAVVVHAPKSIKHDILLPKAPTPAPTVTVTTTVTANPTTGETSPGTIITPGSSTSATP